jgi:hypothetical protein
VNAVTAAPSRSGLRRRYASTMRIDDAEVNAANECEASHCYAFVTYLGIACEALIRANARALPRRQGG